MLMYDELLKQLKHL